MYVFSRRLSLKPRESLFSPRSQLFWSMILTMLHTSLTRSVTPEELKLFCRILAWNSFCFLTIAEQGSCDCSWCGPNWVGCLVASIVQENGSSLLHYQRKIMIGIGNYDCLLTVKKNLVLDLCSLIPLLMTCLQIVHQKTAACLCLTTIKNEDKLELNSAKFNRLCVFGFCKMNS